MSEAEVQRAIAAVNAHFCASVNRGDIAAACSK